MPGVGPLTAATFVAFLPELGQWDSKALYLCACSVIQVLGELRRFYQNLRQRGKPGNMALVAVMRKLLLQLNALARRGMPWVPSAG